MVARGLSPAEEAPPKLTDGGGGSGKRKKRSIDYLLEGTSVRSNRHLARFASAPYLDRLRSDPAMSSMLSRKGRHLRKEIIEAYGLLERVEALLGDDRTAAGSPQPPVAIVDLCSGKGYASVVLACEFPQTAVLMVDNNPKMRTDHVASHPNLHFLRANVMAEGFERRLGEEIGKITRRSNPELSVSGPPSGEHLCTPCRGGGGGDAGADKQSDADQLEAASPSNVANAQPPPRGPILLVGMHLCGELSPRAIWLFSQLQCFDSVVLAPCCLHKCFDADLKEDAKRNGRDPFDAKVEQLCGSLREHAADVSVSYDGAFRSNFRSDEGGVGCKNALIAGRRSRHR